MAILLRLLFAHILSDFVFQNDKICEGKQEKTSKKYVYQLLHSLYLIYLRQSYFLP